jgi:hypothetical protein
MRNRGKKKQQKPTAGEIRQFLSPTAPGKQFMNLYSNIAKADNPSDVMPGFISVMWPPKEWLAVGCGNPKAIISTHALTDKEFGDAVDAMARAVAERLLTGEIPSKAWKSEELLAALGT